MIKKELIQQSEMLNDYAWVGEWVVIGLGNAWSPARPLTQHSSKQFQLILNQSTRVLMHLKYIWFFFQMIAQYKAICQGSVYSYAGKIGMLSQSYRKQILW